MTRAFAKANTASCRVPKAGLTRLQRLQDELNYWLLWTYTYALTALGDVSEFVAKLRRVPPR